MTQIPPRFERMLKAQTVGSLLWGLTSSVFALNECVDILGWSVPTVLLAGIVAYILSRLGILICTMFFQSWFYRGDYAALMADAAIADKFFEERMIELKIRDNGFGPTAPQPTKLQILRKDEKPIGTFQDEPFYDSIDVMGRDGKSYRFTYVGCQDLSKGKKPVVGEGCIMFPPGIIYQVDFSNK